MTQLREIDSLYPFVAAYHFFIFVFRQIRFENCLKVIVVLIMSGRFSNQMEVLFYKYGIFSSRHPVLMIFLSAVIILSCCYPLLNLPIPGSEPQQFFTLLKDMSEGDMKLKQQDFPTWYSHSNRTAYIQQFVVKFSTALSSGKTASTSQLIKAALFSTFSILEEIRNFSLDNSLSIQNDCFHVTTTAIKTKRQLKSMFPENDCLLISPASYWNNHLQKFMADQDIQKTVNQYESKTLKAPPSVKEMMFGLHSKHISFKLKNSVFSYTITLVLKKYNPKLIRSLEKRLHLLYSSPKLEPSYHICEVELTEKNKEICSNLFQFVTNIYYKSQLRFNHLLPLLSTYFLLGCYIYFSVRKINFVKSKIGMAFSAVVSVIASLMMAVGLCSLMGLTPKLNGGEMFPYLVCFIGLENILVITKSVVATHSHFDVDKRIAIGLSREGGSIIKNLFLELVIIGLGYLTYVPRINEFCAFAFVGILTDFFIGMFFFVTVLSLDIRRLDVEDPYQEPVSNDSELLYPVNGKTLKKRNWKRLTKSSETRSSQLEDGGKAQSILKVPRRLRVVFFVADTRMVQRGLMVMVVVWIALLVYSDPAGLFNHNQSSVTDGSLNLDIISSLKDLDEAVPTSHEINWGFKDILSSHYLSFRHWPTLFAYYNITLAEKFISVLPSILVPVPLSQDFHKVFDKKNDKPLNEKPSSSSTVLPDIHFPMHLPGLEYNTLTGLEYYITLIIGAVSGIIIFFLLNIMYQCICSRRYSLPPAPVSDPGECIRIQLKGHSFKIDSVYVEGVTVTSADLSGELRTWDTHSGDCTSVIPRDMVEEVWPDEGPSTSRFQYNPNTQRRASNSLSAVTAKASVWSVVSSGQFIIVGCSDGRIEVWDSASSVIHCKYTSNRDGVVGLACEDRRVVAARITGRLDFFVLEDFMEQQRTHKRTPSDILLHNPAGTVVNLQLLNTVKSAHQQPICAFEMCMRRVLTGSRDNTLKLYNFQDAKCQFTLFGHSSPITVIYMDKHAPAGAVSGSTDGTVWLWDLLSGKGLHKMKKHKGAILSVQCSMHYIVSSAEDCNMCIWSRRTGSLLHKKQLDSCSPSALSLLGQNWCVTGGKGYLFLWDIRNGELIRRFPLAHRSSIQPTVENISVSTDLCVVCVLGHELLVVRFPAVLEKD